MKRNQVVNEATGRVDLRYNPLSIEEDYYIPVRGGTKFASIESVGGQSRNHDIDDVKYLRDKMFSALKIPASYLTQGEGNTEDKTTLAQKDIRFAKTVQRLQRPLISELEKVGIIHLHTLGFRGEDLVNFKLALNNPSKISEIQELEHWNQKFTIATAATDGYFSKRWIAENIFGLSEEEYERNKREMYHDRKYDAELNAVGEMASEAAAGAGLGGGMPTGFEPGGGLPGATDLPVPEVAPEPSPGETPDAAPAAGDEAGGESPLLATPGKRDGRETAGKLKSYIGVSTPETMRGRSNRSKFPGKQDQDLLSKGIYTEGRSNYNGNQDLQEQRIFTINHEMQRLINDLEDMEPKQDET